MRIGTLALLVLVAVAGGIGGAWLWTPARLQDPASIAPVTVGSLRLNIPAGYLRASSAESVGAIERLDAVAVFPAMEPGGRLPQTTAAIAGLDPQMRVFMAFSTSEGDLEPSERPDLIYGRFLTPDAWSNPGGLVLRRFEPGSPYGDEELYLAPPDGRTFAARCRKADASHQAIGETCIWRFRQRDVDIQVRFAPALLPQWEALATGVRGLIARWAVP